MKTTEAERLFEDNQKLAMYFLWKHFPAFGNDEDMQQEALLGLWKACITYDPSKAEFSTWAGYAVRSQIGTTLRRINKQLDAVSLEATIEGTDGLKLEDIVEEVVPSICVGYIDLKDFLKTLSGKELTIVQYRIQGFSQDQVSQIVGHSQPYCSRLLNRVYKRYKERSM